MKNFNRTELWAILHDAESTIAGSGVIDINVALGEFTSELHGYCRGEKDLSERMRTLRVARSGLVATAQKRERHEAGEKWASPCRRQPCDSTSVRPHRLRTGNHSYGAG